VPDPPRTPAEGFVGGARTSEVTDALPVRHDVHRPGTEIVTMRYFKIRPGTFDRFLAASVEGVWPFYEKLGARVVGMWRVTGRDGPPATAAAAANDNAAAGGEAGFDEVYLVTRYASVEHWEATRDPQRIGGNGPDWEACRRALEERRSLTLETRLLFLEGAMASNGPYFQPALPERYRRVDEEAPAVREEPPR
jgi:hypothetical protein